MPTTNHLKNETSAYLLQHMHNPVDWHPWNAETLALARELNKPILLSIGYSACHWCHVMAHESFEDEVTAAIMNNDFVNIKVDKEERPDLDKIYQTAHQLINNRPGGWPLTAVLDPKTLLPFFVGTYFPKEPRFGMMPFNDVLQQIAVFFNQEKDQLASHQQQLREVLAQISADHPITQEDLNAQSLTVATQQLMQLYDKQNGGFGQQPKFPQPSNLERLLRYSFYDKTQQEQCLSIVNTTLTKMALGGIYDHLGGGFFRYSVDARWMIPHFEKMLYDNAQLLSLYSDVITIDKNPLYLQHIKQTADWVIREMQAPNGGYYATLDADSEGEEGKFYIWHKQDIEAALNKEEYEIFATTFALNRPPNFEGHWHLYVADSASYPPQANSLLDSACQKLFAIREKRIRPARDEKIITSWNGLMIKGMAKAGEATHNKDFIDSAVKSVDFIYANLWQDQRLLSTYQAGKARFNAYLDDYAYLLDGILYLLEAKWSNQHLEFAIKLAETLIKDFWDAENYGFFFTSHDHESLIYRPKPLTDEALPAGNGVAALALLRLGYLLGELRYIDIAQQTLLAAKPSVDHLPYAHNTLLHALEAHLHPPTMIIIRGSKDELAKWQKLCRQYYFPQQHVFAIPNDAAELPAALNGKKASAKTTAYICKGTECLMPLDDLGELEKWLKRG